MWGVIPKAFVNNNIRFLSSEETHKVTPTLNLIVVEREVEKVGAGSPIRKEHESAYGRLLLLHGNIVSERGPLSLAKGRRLTPF